MGTDIKTVIIAAGKGSRMRSGLPKCMNAVLGKTMIRCVADAARGAGSESLAVVVGVGAELVRGELSGYEGVTFYTQERQLGTGHAVMAAEAFVTDDDDAVLILQGDVPLTRAETLAELAEYHLRGGFAATLVSFTAPGGLALGRISRGDGAFTGIVEKADRTGDAAGYMEYNAGVYCVKGGALKRALKSLTTDNAQGEYYLTDVFNILQAEGLPVGILERGPTEEFIGVNDPMDLARATKAMRAMVNFGLMSQGVIMPDPELASVSPDAVVGPGTVIYPGTVIEGRSDIGGNCVIGPNTILTDTIVGEGTTVLMSVVKQARIGSETTVGPFAYIRPDSVIGDHVKIGDFVEVKNAVIGDGTKLSHLTYVGDADVGRNVNFGCGTVVVNYDGVKKSRTVVKDKAFIGCNTNLIAPVTVGEGAYTAAGSTITTEVPPEALAVARARQANIEGWVTKRNARKNK